MYKNYEQFSEERYRSAINKVCTGLLKNDLYLGSVELGMLCIDIIALQSCSIHSSIKFVIYVGGADSDYGVTPSGMRYDCVDGDIFITDANLHLYSSYDEFQKSFEDAVSAYVSVCGYRNTDGRTLSDFMSSDKHGTW